MAEVDLCRIGFGHTFFVPGIRLASVTKTQDIAIDA